MRIRKSQLKILIENYINESDTGPMQGAISLKKDTDTDQDDFELTDDMLDPDQSSYEEYVASTDAYEHPEKPMGNMPHFGFGDSKGINLSTKGRHIPSNQEIDHVRRRQSKEIGGPMPSVSDIETTIPNFGEHEKTDPSPLGTQYSLEETEPQFRYDDYTAEDDGYTAHSDDDFYLGPENEEGYEEPSEYPDEPDTEYGIETSKPGFISKIRKALGV